jgi:hypothetical protein
LPAVPARVFRRVNSDRVMPLEDNHLVAGELSLWTRIRDERGSLATPLPDGGISSEH